MIRLLGTFLWLIFLALAVWQHNHANAQRPLPLRHRVRRGSLRWWLPWPQRSEFLAERTWRQARLGFILIHACAVGGAGLALASFISESA